MNLNTKPGDEIIYAYPDNGTTWDKQACEDLEVGAIYALAKIEVGDWKSWVWLEGVPGVFNSVMFANRVGGEDDAFNKAVDEFLEENSELMDALAEGGD